MKTRVELDETDIRRFKELINKAQNILYDDTMDGDQKEIVVGYLDEMKFIVCGV